MEPCVSVISLAPYSIFRINREEGTFIMPARKQHERYAKLVVSGTHKTKKDFGEGQFEWYTTPAKALAEDLIRDCSQHGAFILDGDVEPSEQRLLDEEEKLKQTYAKWIEEADGIFNRTGDVKLLTLHAREAAKALGVKRAWVSGLENMTLCEFCKGSVPYNVAKCSNCGAILNWEMARRGGLVSPEQIKIAVKKGWLQPEEEEDDRPSQAPAALPVEVGEPRVRASRK